ncbi:hypothetical protein RhiirC2_792483 [Rhizophagus irregularis]|uniref:Uncharacterized protein n=1 Tax=Rhizophagus irregularis TaxID=588596 RepID=A0A2N1MHA3_9GLOM|nr:hypothetical protein RhiirC2_792483 [Rhizophagus irregularis]
MMGSCRNAYKHAYRNAVKEVQEMLYQKIEHVSIPEEISPVSSMRKNEIIADLPVLPHISEIGALDDINNLWYFHLEDVTKST